MQAGLFFWGCLYSGIIGSWVIILAFWLWDEVSQGKPQEVGSSELGFVGSCLHQDLSEVFGRGKGCESVSFSELDTN